MYARTSGGITASPLTTDHAPSTGGHPVSRRIPFNVRTVRLVTGLTLFTYIGTHLLNHSLGNVSVSAMEAGLVIQKWIWQGILGTAALYLALSTHFCLGLWAFYQRRHFGWTRTEVTQLVLGLCIPLLLMNHLFVTRIALTQFGLQKGYAQELYSFWVAAPRLGVLQVLVLIVAWAHGCIGVCLWLRLKPFFEWAKPALLCAAIMLPVLALLGFYQGGRTILAMAQDPTWRAANLNPWQVGHPAENARLLLERDTSLLAFAGLLVIVLFARGARAVREQFGGIVRVTYPDGRSARIPRGFSVLEASRSARIPHASICGGRARCSTCRIRIVAGSGRIAAPSAVERAVLDKVGAGPLVRLACQLRPENDISVVPLLPPYWSASTLRTSTIPRPGEERFIVVMVVDMRNSSRLATTRLPFDVVFIIDRFINVVGAAVTEAGGVANHFTGDGLMATFGLMCSADLACRQAVNALGLIGRNVTALNRVLEADMAETIAFGVGVHGSSAVVGEVGYGQSRVFTTLGDAANLAARLETACKDFQCEAVLSETVLERSGYRSALFDRHDLAIRGREVPLVVHTIARIEVLHDVPHETATPLSNPHTVRRMGTTH